MKTIVSRRHPFYFHSVIALAVIFGITIFIGSLLFFIAADGNGTPQLNHYIALLAGTGLLVFSIHSIYIYFRDIPKVSVNKNTIQFGKKSYPFSSIKEFNPVGKQPFKVFASTNQEGAKLIFNNNDIKYIYYDFYSNADQIVFFLNSNLANPLNHNQLQHQQNVSLIRKRELTTYKGALLTSLRGISLWGFILFFSIKLIESPPDFRQLLTVLLISTVWITSHSFFLFYFQVSNDQLVVKNHNMFWINRVYQLSEIREIIFETGGKMPNTLRIITKDFKNKKYQAGTLRDKTWLALKSHLEENNISVRNECIIK